MSENSQVNVLVTDHKPSVNLQARPVITESHFEHCDKRSLDGWLETFRCNSRIMVMVLATSLLGFGAAFHHSAIANALEFEIESSEDHALSLVVEFCGAWL
ncbi:hypothetical protein CDAR_43171 [Caerostris darwini]|uniref:Uncharacterized protein n=1 Tax=Caerostris darwini TaxID=1538125 RepID=A0AAV4WI38_9ARAC|nr:hypothetical protein CDAR_43171 [Caerostris darwini]